MFEKFHRGDIYSADLSPGIGSEQSGSRPVLILQNNVGNCFSPTIIIAAITSVNLICIEEGIDSSQTSGKLLISVLSAVAEIERENIIEQTMNGRREKARQGGWNGGFAPYGYTLEDNKLMIEETEAVAIRKIFELYTSSEIGLGGIANQLNLQGIGKMPLPLCQRANIPCRNLWMVLRTWCVIWCRPTTASARNRSPCLEPGHRKHLANARNVVAKW